jgi:EmrB/QacA subfamily drug resistance transporter
MARSASGPNPVQLALNPGRADSSARPAERNPVSERSESLAVVTPAPERSESHAWIVLTLLSLTQFILVIDVSIVNVALSSIQHALAFSEANLQWILSAYTLTFGGLLLLGGRAGDLLGRRRVFMAGLIVFTFGSALCGFAQSELMLILSRALQGVGAAAISPGALSILMTTFPEGSERNRALGVWGAIAGVGGAVGVLAGGILVQYLSWRWIFLVNLPIGLTVLILTPRYVRESRGTTGGRLDVAGAVSITGGLALLIFGLTHAQTTAWSNAVTIAALIASAVLIVGFVVIEARVSDPILPLRIFRIRSVTGANVVGFLLGSSIFATFFFLSLYMQQVLGIDALGVGLRYLLLAGVIILAAGISQALVTRFGVRPILAIGMLLLMIGLLYFTNLRVDGTYIRDLVPGFILVGVGLGFAFVPVSIAALEGVTGSLAGAASGLINTSQQVGGAVGVAVLSTIAVTVSTNHVTKAVKTAVAAGGSAPHAAAAAAPQALVDGFQTAFYVAAATALVGLVCTVLLIRRQPRSVHL